MKVATAAVTLVLLLAGCGAAPSSTVDHAPLQREIGELAGVDEASVDRVVYDDGRQTELVVTVTTSDATGIDQLAADAAQRIDAASFGDDTRELRLVIGDSLLSVRAARGDDLDASITATFSRWLADPRVATIRWAWQLELVLVGDGSTDGSLVETIYTELADATTLDHGGLLIADPGSFTIATAQHAYTENRFGAAREIAGLAGVSACSFQLDASSDGSFVHQIYCSVEGEPATTGEQVNALLAARGLLESTDVRLQSPDDSIVTNDGSSVFDES